MIRMSKKMYVGALAASLALFLLLVVPPLITLFSGAFRSNEKVLQLFVFLIVLGVFQLIIFQFVCTLTLLYKMWSAIQDGHARTTPGKAMGFLFIPFFNLYWIFQVWAGFPTDYNAYVERYQLPVPNLSAGIYKSYPVLILLSAIPFVGIVTATVASFVLLAIMAKTCDAVNALADAAQERHKELGKQTPTPQFFMAKA